MIRNALVGVAAALASGFAQAASKYNFPPPESEMARIVYDLHITITWICIVVFVAVFGVMFYSVFKHRKSVGHKAANFHENTTVEVLWTVIPTIILVVMAFPATTALLKMRDTSASDMTIKATGYQWKWGYEYIKGEGEGISVFSVLATPRDQIEGKAPKGENYLREVDHPLVVPAGKKVRILTTGADVIHSFWVPALAIKQDANPGFIRDAYFKADRPGTFRGQCAELCGKDHGFMPIVVEVKSAADYSKWVEEQKKKMAATALDANKTWTLDELKAHGAQVYAKNCQACHQPTGLGVPGAFPALSGSKMTVGPKDAQVALILNGVQKDGKPTAMAAFKDQLSDVDLAAVVTYTRNNWDNKAGDLVQPSEVKAARK